LYFQEVLKVSSILIFQAILEVLILVFSSKRYWKSLYFS